MDESQSTSRSIAPDASTLADVESDERVIDDDNGNEMNNSSDSSDDEEVDTSLVSSANGDVADQQQPSVISIPTATRKSMKRKRIRRVINDDLLSDAARDARQRETERLARRGQFYPNIVDGQIDSLIEPKIEIDSKPIDSSNIEIIELSDDDEVDPPQCSSSSLLSARRHFDTLTSNLNHRLSYPTTSIASSPRKRRDSDDLENTDRTREGRLLVNQGKPADDPDIYVLPHLTGVLQPHQLGGVRFLYDNIIESVQDYAKSAGFGCILAHSMGLGKTLQIITFTDIFLRCTRARRVLIIVPINTIQNWLREFDRWLPRMNGCAELIRTFIVHMVGDSVKTIEQRAAVVDEWYRTGGVLLIGYEMFRLLTQATRAIHRRKRTKPNGDNRSEVIDIEEEEVRETSIATLREALIDPGPDLVVCDEGHRIKNLKTEIAITLNSIRTRRRIVLTGYPLQNNLLEYYCMVDFVRPNFLGTKKEFSNMFERPIKNGQCLDSTPRDFKTARQRTHVLVELLKGFVQRRSHHLLKSILPRSREYVLMLRKSAIQRELYRQFLIYARSEMDYKSTAIFNPLKAFAACCKIWNHPDILYKVVTARRNSMSANNSLLENVEKASTSSVDAQSSTLVDFDLNDAFDTSNVAAALAAPADLKYDWADAVLSTYSPGCIENGYKMVMALAIIDESTRLGDKVLLFSQSLYTLDLIQFYLEQRARLQTPTETHDWKKNRNYLRFDGSTSATEREKLIARFNNEQDIYLFLISTRAGSLGINLVASNRVIIFDASWNPCHDAQAVCRVYRYGQQKATFIYRLIVDNSMERAIFSRQISKQGLQQRVIDDHNIDANVTKSELENLLVYDEAVDTIENEWDVAKWDIDDGVLWSVSMRYSQMFAQMPFLHESLMLERGGDAMSAEEKVEAKLLYEHEKKQYNTPMISHSNDVFNAAEYGRYPPIRPPPLPLPSSSSSRGWPGPTIGFPTFRIGQKPTATVRPLKSTPYPMSIQAAGQHFPIDRRQFDSYIPMDVYDQLGMQQTNRSTTTHPGERVMQFDREMTLPSMTHVGRNVTVFPGQRASVSYSHDGACLRLPDGNMLDARSLPREMIDNAHHNRKFDDTNVASGSSYFADPMLSHSSSASTLRPTTYRHQSMSAAGGQQQHPASISVIDLCDDDDDDGN